MGIVEQIPRLKDNRRIEAITRRRIYLKARQPELFLGVTLKKGGNRFMWGNIIAFWEDKTITRESFWELLQ